MNSIPFHPILRRAVLLLGLAILVFTAASTFDPTLRVARAQTEADLLEQKAQWQERYRILLRNIATLKQNAEKSRHNYAQAQRRNYPRGGARDQFRIDEEKANAQIVEMKAQIEQLLLDARRAGLPKNWFYEVDDEPIMPAAPAGQADSRSNEDDGRNPLYRQDDDER